MDSICNRCGHFDDRTHLCQADQRRTTQRVNCPYFVWHDLLLQKDKDNDNNNNDAKQD